MGSGTKSMRENRTITVDFHDESHYFQLICDGTAFVEFVLAFVLSIGFQLAHKATCRGGGCLTPPLPLCPASPGRPHHLAHPVCLVQGGLHGLTTLHLALSPHEPRGRPPSLDRHPRRPQLGMGCHCLPYLAHGPLSLDLCLGATWPGHRADPVSPAAAHVYPGR